MNVAVIEPTDGEIEVQPAVAGSEWIDPEGDDWLALIYRILTHETGTTTALCGTAESEHWFG